MNEIRMVDITKLREELATIPKGCISHKRINGKVYCYRQWTEGGKTRSEYLSEGEAERFKEQVARRRELQRELSRLARESETRKDISVQTMEVTERHVKDIRDWMERLDLIATCRVRRSDGSDDVPRTIFTQPGMRYCQVQALVFAIGADSRMRRFGEGVMSRVCEMILNDVRGRMLEDIVLCETTRSLARQGAGLSKPSAFKVLFPSGEFDMVVADPRKGTCDICEIKHTAVRTDDQFRHLVDPDKCAAAEKSFGRIASRVVYYRGPDFDHASGVKYLNVENYLAQACS